MRLDLWQMLDGFASKFGRRVVRARQLEMIYQHEYRGGYAEYRETQIKYNKRKQGKVWADKTTLGAIVDDLKAQGLGATGICHGARNGFEVTWLRDALSADVIGTDISDSATDYPHMHVWDFQDENPDWDGKFDFVYTNSLDQAMEPERALAAWTKQLTPQGRIYIEHTMAHSTKGVSHMDPFGAHPTAMPYLFFQWGRGLYKMVDIIDIEAKANKAMRAWVFVLTREDAGAA